MKDTNLYVLKNQFNDSILFIGTMHDIYKYLDTNTIYNIDLYDFENNYIKSYILRTM